LPGLDGCGELFYKQAEDLARDHTVVRLSLRGDSPHTLSDLIGDAHAAWKNAGQGPATVLGESFGGLLAMATALEHPEMVSRLLLVNTFPAFSRRALIHFGVAAYSFLPFPLLRAAAQIGAPRMLCNGVAPDDLRRYTEITGALSRHSYVWRLRIVRDTDLRPRLGELRMPVVVVATEADRLLDSERTARALVSALPRARLRIVPGAGHAALLASEIRVRDWLADFEGL
jgi:pimeloyl-ACP methyl ester carboxylesterase